MEQEDTSNISIILNNLYANNGMFTVDLNILNVIYWYLPSALTAITLLYLLYLRFIYKKSEDKRKYYQYGKKVANLLIFFYWIWPVLTFFFNGINLLIERYSFLNKEKYLNAAPEIINIINRHYKNKFFSQFFLSPVIFWIIIAVCFLCFISIITQDNHTKEIQKAYNVTFLYLLFVIFLLIKCRREPYTPGFGKLCFIMYNVNIFYYLISYFFSMWVLAFIEEIFELLLQQKMTENEDQTMETQTETIHVV